MTTSARRERRHITREAKRGDWGRAIQRSSPRRVILEEALQNELNRDWEILKVSVCFSVQVIRVVGYAPLSPVQRSRPRFRSTSTQAMVVFIGPLPNSVDQQVDDVMAGLGMDSPYSDEDRSMSKQAMAAFIGPLSTSVDQQVDEVMAGLGMDPPHSDEVESFETFTGGVGYGGGYGLMKPKKLLERPRRSYDVTVGGYTVRVDVKKKCLILRRSPPPVVGCRNSVNNRGDLTIGFGHGRPLRSHARLAHTRGPWKLVLEVLGIG